MVIFRFLQGLLLLTLALFLFEMFRFYCMPSALPESLSESAQELERYWGLNSGNYVYAGYYFSVVFKFFAIATPLGLMALAFKPHPDNKEAEITAKDPATRPERPISPNKC